MVYLVEILEEALQQAKVGRVHILNHMLILLFPEPRTGISAVRPKIITMTINAQIKSVTYRPSGKQIK